MRILICGDSMGVGGAETHILALSRGLAALGHRVTVAADKGPLAASLEESGVRFCELTFGSATGFRRLRKLIGKGGFDVVHAHSRMAALSVTVIRQSLCRPGFGFVVTAHALYRSDMIKDALSVWGDECIAVGRDIEGMLIRRYRLPRRSVTFIPNGIDKEGFRPLKRPIRPHRILCASRLDGDCSLGAELLCEVLPRLSAVFPDVTLTIAGGGDRYAEIKRKADEVNLLLGRRAVDAVGAVTDMPELIADCDCAVGVSRFALEAAAMDKNVILFGNEGALGLLSPDNWQKAASTNFTARGEGVGNGRLLLRELVRLFKMSDRERRIISCFCRGRVLSCYTSDAMVRSTLRVYERTVHRPTVLLGGYYGFGNLGDETVRRILIRDLLSAIPRVRIMTLSASPKVTGGIDRYSPMAVIDAMRRSDVYISGGGSLLQSSTSLRSLAYYCALISLARMLGCRVAAVANGVGPLKSKTAEKMAAAVLGKCGYISLRDRRSLGLVARLTEGKMRVRLSADPAFSLPLDEGGGDRRGIACSFRNGEAVSETAARLLGDRIFEKCRRVPMEVAGSRSAPRAVSGKAVGVIEGSRYAVGSRLHFLIFALLLGVPFAAVGNDPKLTAFSELTLGVPAISPEEFDSPGKLSAEIERYLFICEEFYRRGGRERVLTEQRKLYKDDLSSLAAWIARTDRKMFQND